jgi:hypothetical protein
MYLKSTIHDMHFQSDFEWPNLHFQNLNGGLTCLILALTLKKIAKQFEKDIHVTVGLLSLYIQLSSRHSSSRGNHIPSSHYFKSFL